MICGSPVESISRTQFAPGWPGSRGVRDWGVRNSRCLAALVMTTQRRNSRALIESNRYYIVNRRDLLASFQRL